MKQFKTFEVFINEGKYDKEVGSVVDDMWKIIKFSKMSYDLDNTEDTVAYDIDYSKRKPLRFILRFIVKRENLGGSFRVDANISDDGEDVAVFLNIDPKSEPQIYSQLNSKLHDSVAHELEHSTQKDGNNFSPGKAKPTSADIRELIQTDPKRIWEYFLLADEVPAMVRGMYKQAKVEKNSLTDVFDTYISHFVSDGIITKSQKNKIIKVWVDYAKKNLPAAILK